MYTYPVPTEAEYDFEQWFSTGDDFAPEGTLAMSRDIFGCHDWGSGWGARDAATHPIMCRTVFITKNYLTQNISSAEVERHRFRMK